MYGRLRRTRFALLRNENPGVDIQNLWHLHSCVLDINIIPIVSEQCFTFSSLATDSEK